MISLCFVTCCLLSFVSQPRDSHVKSILHLPHTQKKTAPLSRKSAVAHILPSSQFTIGGGLRDQGEHRAWRIHKLMISVGCCCGDRWRCQQLDDKELMKLSRASWNVNGGRRDEGAGDVQGVGDHLAVVIFCKRLMTDIFIYLFLHLFIDQHQLTPRLAVLPPLVGGNSGPNT